MLVPAIKLLVLMRLALGTIMPSLCDSGPSGAILATDCIRGYKMPLLRSLGQRRKTALLANQYLRQNHQHRIDLLVAADADPQAVTPTWIVHVTHEDPVLLERFV